MSCTGMAGGSKGGGKQQKRSPKVKAVGNTFPSANRNHGNKKTIFERVMENDRCPGACVTEEEVLSDPINLCGHLAISGSTKHMHYSYMKSFHKITEYDGISAKILDTWEEAFYFCHKKRSIDDYTNLFLDVYWKAPLVKEMYRSDKASNGFWHYCVRSIIKKNIDNLNSQDPQIFSGIYGCNSATIFLILFIRKCLYECIYEPEKILHKVLGLLVGFFVQGPLFPPGQFNPLPYHMLLHNILVHLPSKVPFSKPAQFKVVLSFCHALRLLKPLYMPCYAFNWINFLNYPEIYQILIFDTPNREGWKLYTTLLGDNFEYLHSHYSEKPQLVGPIVKYYRKVLDLLESIKNTVPELLSSYCHMLYPIIPDHCVQIRSIILATTPIYKNVNDILALSRREKDSFIKNTAFRYKKWRYGADLSDFAKGAVDIYLGTNLNNSDKCKLLNILHEMVVIRNQSFMNSLIMYIANHAVTQTIASHKGPIKGNQIQMKFETSMENSPHFEIFIYLLRMLNYYPRNWLLNTIVSNLRYPDLMTIYLTRVLACLYNTSTILIKQHILKRILEELIVQRVMPWGVLTILEELVNKPKYKFPERPIWNYLTGFEKELIFLLRNSYFDIHYLKTIMNKQYNGWVAGRLQYARNLENRWPNAELAQVL